MAVDDLIALLDLRPHPEGGFYRETWRDVPAGGEGGGEGGRGAGTAIYFLLRAGDEHRWHRVDSVEIWHHYDGAPLELSIVIDNVVVRRTLGRDLGARQRPQIIVPAGAWQRARCLGDHTLVGCTVSPAFQFESFEMAPPGWEPTP